MKRYWDSSALVDALHDEAVRQVTQQPEQFTRPHALTEVFSTLTGGRLGFRYLPEEAAAMIRDLVLGFQFVELSAAEVQQALTDAGRRGVRGGRVHDWLHARAAAKAGVTELLTDNLDDFAGLEAGFTVRVP